MLECEEMMFSFRKESMLGSKNMRAQLRALLTLQVRVLPGDKSCIISSVDTLVYGGGYDSVCTVHGTVRCARYGAVCTVRCVAS